MTIEECDDGMDYTAKGIEFAPWDTGVDDDDLHLVGPAFRPGIWVTFPSDGFKLALPEADDARQSELEATFLSRDKRAAVRFLFDQVAAFRVLDEGGLLDLWLASERSPRPASSTFRVRGHAWQAESFLVWYHGADEHHFSYMIATDSSCLEVVAFGPPLIELLPAVATPLTLHRE